MESVVLETGCCVVGGGPAGMMLGYLLARMGVQVTVLEKHADFFRDFRGDTVHPSTLEVLNEIGLLREFLDLPHQRVESLGVMIGGTTFEVADFRHVPGKSKFVALMPQWDFLNFLSTHANRFPSFQLLMQHEATDLVRDRERVSEVVAETESGQVYVRADLVVACDGRHSAMRKSGGLQVIEHGVPIDVLWFRISRKPEDPAQVLGNVNYGKALILINRSDYFQAGLIIAKGTFEEIKAGGPGLPRRYSANCAIPGRPRQRTAWLGTDQNTDGTDQSTAAMAPARSAVHRRCGACHVSCRWSWNQSCNPRCRGSRQSLSAATAGGARF